MKQISIVMLTFLFVIFSGCLMTDSMDYNREKQVFEKYLVTVSGLLSQGNINLQENEKFANNPNSQFADRLFYISELAAKANQVDDFNKVWMPQMLKNMATLCKKSYAEAKRYQDVSNTDNYNRFNFCLAISGRCKEDLQKVISKYWSPYEVYDYMNVLLGDLETSNTESDMYQNSNKSRKPEPRKYKAKEAMGDY